MAYSRKYIVGKNQLSITCNNSAGEKKWYVFYLRPRAENRVYRTLTNLNYEVFWPVIQSIRIWKNRQKKKIKLPLFPNYLFVYAYAYELYSIKCLPHVVTYISCGGKPSTISESEIEGIRRMLGLDRAITVETKFYNGERVRIMSGLLKGYEGVLVKQHGKTRFGIQLRAINHTIFIEVARSELEKL
ncbi:MAG TPA: UpxY family transcription antiterminator [Prolixibacteraceae bacterium]|nr:UpxY family transcription antiterminator [Prolixibacteraceae bacterium]